MNLQKHFTEVKDFRVETRCLHELSDILITLLLGILADSSDFPEIEDYAKDKEAFLREDLGLLLLSGIPSEDTLSHVVRFLKPAELECIKKCEATYAAVLISSGSMRDIMGLNLG